VKVELGRCFPAGHSPVNDGADDAGCCGARTPNAFLSKVLTREASVAAEAGVSGF